MRRNTRRDRRIFIEGWISESDPVLLALVWYLEGPSGSWFEAEVVRDDRLIAVTRGDALEEVKKHIAEQASCSESPTASG